MKSPRQGGGLRRMAVCALLILARIATAHEDPGDRIVRLSRAIDRAPGDASLYVQRGELRRLEGRCEGALSDFETAERLAPPSAHQLSWLLARTLLQCGRPLEAIEHFDIVLRDRPDHAEALLGRARALTQTKGRGAAADDWDRALSSLSPRRPEHYLERARATADPTRAIAGLEEGIRELGDVVALHLETVELQCAAGDDDGALRRLDRLSRAARRPETWLVRRAQVLERAGRCNEAAQAWRAALHALDALPDRHRRTVATTAIEARIVAGVLESGRREE